MKRHILSNQRRLLTTIFSMAVLFCLEITSLVTVADADEPTAVAPLRWVESFSALSGPNAKNSLVVIVLTNDSPFPTKEIPTPNDSLWCLPMFESVYRKALIDRPDLKDRIIVQKQAVGTPPVIAGGQSRNQPARAVLAVCDTKYRLLSLMIGVPDQSGFMTLIEDAEQISTLLQIQNANEKQRMTAVSEYTSEKMTRIWRKSLEQMIYTVASGEDDDEVSAATETDKELISRIGRIGETFESIYLADVKLRFALSDISDRVRLTILEQHPEARRPWCNAIMPFVAGEDFNKIWRTMLELVWKTSPVTNETPNTSELVKWWDSENAHKTIVLAIEPPILTRMQRWPPINVGDVAAKRGVGWTDLQDVIIQKAYRNVGSQELATLIRDRKLNPIDIGKPARARYVFFEAKQSKGIAIRESDLPAKYVGRIKRMK